MFKKYHSTRIDGSTSHLIDQSSSDQKLVYGVTVGVSAFALMRGQLRWFSSNGWDVILACSPDEEARLTVEREQIAFHGISTQRDISPISDIRSLWRWISFLRKTRPHAVNVGTPKAGLLGSLAAWLTGVPKRIYVVRGLRLEGARGYLALILWIMERLTLALATDVVVVSRSLAKELLERKLVPAEKSWIIGEGSSNGVDAPTIAARVNQVDRYELRRKHGIPPEAVSVGFIGRVTKDKGVGTLIEAFVSGHLSKDIQLVIVGAVEDSELAEEVSALGDRVHVLPWTSDLWGTLPILDVLCLPTRREGFPNVVLEAASAGIPTVTTRATGAVDSVVDAVTGFTVDVDDSVGLTEALNQYVVDPSLLKRHGTAAKLRAQQDFAPEVIWRGLQALLRGDYQAEGLTRIDKLRKITAPKDS